MIAALAILRAGWAALKTPLGQVLAVCLIFGSLALWHGHERYGDGVQAERGRWEARLKADAEKARGKEAKNEKAGQRVESEAKAASVEIRWKTKTLIEKVPVYVPNDPPGWSLPVGFVRLHRAATSGLPVEPGSAGLPDDAGSGVALSTLAELDIDNAGICHVEIDRLTRLQDWVRETR